MRELSWWWVLDAGWMEAAGSCREAADEETASRHLKKLVCVETYVAAYQC